MRNAQLVGSALGQEMACPTIMDQDRTIKSLGKVRVDSGGAPVLWEHYVGGELALPGPEPIVFAIYPDARLIGADNFCVLDLFSYQIVGGPCLYGKTVQDVADGALWDGQIADIPEKFAHPLKREVLARMHIGDRGLDIGAIAYGRSYVFRKDGPVPVSAGTDFPKDPVFRIAWKDDGNIDYLSLLEQLFRGIGQIVPATIAKIRFMVDDLVRICGHFQGRTFMAWLAARFFAGFSAQALVL